jgi:hypothetical protein
MAQALAVSRVDLAFLWKASPGAPSTTVGGDHLPQDRLPSAARSSSTCRFGREPAQSVPPAFSSEFCCGMYHDIGAVIKRTTAVGSSEGVINDQRYARLVRDCGNGFNVQSCGERKAWREISAKSVRNHF